LGKSGALVLATVAEMKRAVLLPADAEVDGWPLNPRFEVRRRFGCIGAPDDRALVQPAEIRRSPEDINFSRSTGESSFSSSINTSATIGGFSPPKLWFPLPWVKPLSAELRHRHGAQGGPARSQRACTADRDDLERFGVHIASASRTSSIFHAPPRSIAGGKSRFEIARLFTWPIEEIFLDETH